MTIRLNKRSDTYRLENAHPEEKHFDDGRPIFDGRSKHVVKRVYYSTVTCPECGAVCYNDSKGRASCGDECGGFHDRDVLSYEELRVFRLNK